MAILLEKLKFKTQFGDIHIPIQIIEGLNFKTGFRNVLIDIPSSIHPLADGITIPIYNGNTPFPTDSSYVVRGQLDDYSIRADLSNNRLYAYAINHNFTILLTDRSVNGNLSGFYPIFGDTYGNYWSWLSGQDQYRFSETAVDQFVQPTGSRVGFASYASYSRPYTGREDLAANSPGVIYLTDLLNSWSNMPVPDPYNPGGETETGGGEGDFDNTSDPIPQASLPTLSAVDAKFISLYTPTLTELQSLASYMWSPLFDLDTLKKLFADPMKAILGLSIVPFAVPSSGQQAITIGNISTGVNMTKASAQYVQIDCGTLNVNEYWGAYLDYSPYTKLEIYLPYIGTKQISIDDVMNKACHVYYNIDILTGACCAMIKCDDSVLYSYAGQCATSIPITGNDWTNVVSGALSTALSVVGVAAGAVTGSAPLTGASAIGLVSSASQNVMQMKPIIEKSGSLGGSAGMLGVQTPYLILTRPRQALPTNQNHFTGYPSFINVRLGDLTGMTFVEQVHLENVPCTSSEQSEIETLLKGGVIF